MEIPKAKLAKVGEEIAYKDLKHGDTVWSWCWGCNTFHNYTFHSNNKDPDTAKGRYFKKLPSWYKWDGRQFKLANEF